MKIKKISANGYLVNDVFDQTLYNEISNLIDNFVPDSIRPTDDSPEMPDPLPGARRESIILTGNLQNRIIEHLQNNLADLFEDEKIGKLELWRDYTGYYQFKHYDAPIVKHILIVYFGNSVDSQLGTWYTEEGQEYRAEYIENSGLILKNTGKVLHGLNKPVEGQNYRKALYLNWLNQP
jgi:hypothetical protein